MELSSYHSESGERREDEKRLVKEPLKLKRFQRSTFETAEGKMQVKNEIATTSVPFFIGNAFCSTESSHTCFAEIHEKQEDAMKLLPKKCSREEINAEASDKEEDMLGCNTGRWTNDEHKLFIEALKLYGKSWKKIQQHVGTRITTQIRSHAQKFFHKMGRGESNMKKISTAAKFEVTKDHQQDISELRYRSEVGNANLQLSHKFKARDVLKQYGPGRTFISVGNAKSDNGKSFTNFSEENFGTKKKCLEEDTLLAEDKEIKKLLHGDWEHFDNIEDEPAKPLLLEDQIKSAIEFKGYSDDKLLIDFESVLKDNDLNFDS
jgi:SHAQKYF class myb-like DNA-binding protein